MSVMKNMKKRLVEKKLWQEHIKRVKQLPQDYQIVYKEVQKYLFSFPSGEEAGTMTGLQQLVDFLEEGAKKQLPVLTYIGPNIGEFAENYRQALISRGERSY